MAGAGEHLNFTPAFDFDGGFSVDHQIVFHEAAESSPFRNALPPPQHRLEHARALSAKAERARQFKPKLSRAEFYFQATADAINGISEEVISLLWGYAKLFSFFGILLVGCANNPVFDRYLESFSERAKGENIVYKAPVFEFGHPRATELSSTNLAECVPRSAITKARVVVDKEQWETLSEPSKEALVFHEMGHCALGEAHGDGIMQASLISDKEYIANRIFLIGRLFHHEE